MSTAGRRGYRFSLNYWRKVWLACAVAVTAILPAHAQTPGETVLHSFAPKPYKGEYPESGVTRDSAGNLYGTASAGGPMGAGLVYKVDAAGIYSVLYAFTGGIDGRSPFRRSDPRPGRQPVRNCFHGERFCIQAGYGVAGDGAIPPQWRDGGGPEAGVIRDSAGNL